MLKSKSNTFVTNENKGMLWGLLQESNVFDGIENEKFKNIQNMFEDTIDAINKSNTQLSLLEKNKMTMETLLKRISDEKSKPKKNPEVGGSNFKVGGKPYTFGGLCYEFYYSGELQDLFPLTGIGFVPVKELEKKNKHLDAHNKKQKDKEDKEAKERKEKLLLEEKEETIDG